MKTSRIIWLVAGIVGTLGVIALIVFGVLNRNEAGLLNPEVTWRSSEFPLLMEVDVYSVEAPSEEDVQRAHEATDDAISFINDRLGFEAYRRVDLVPRNHVHVLVGVPQESVNSDTIGESGIADAGGTFSLSGSEAHWTHCNIQTSNTGNLLDLVLKHELGHCLGLAHDESSRSIMFPVQKDFSGFPPDLSDHDIKILRDLYAP